MAKEIGGFRLIDPIEPRAKNLPVPVGDKVCIRLAKNPTVSSGGLHLPQTSQRQPNYGTIVSIGSGKLASEMKVGDVVHFDYHCAFEIVVENEKFIVMRAEDVLATHRE